MIPRTFYVASILSELEDGTKKFIEMPLNMFGKIINMVYDFLRINPTEGKYKDAWNAVSNLNKTFLVIGTTLITIFFLWGFCRDSIDIKQDMHMESIIKLLIRYVISVNLVTSFINYVPDLCGWAVSLVGAVDPSITFDSGKIAQGIIDNTNVVMGFIIALLLFLICFACGAIMIFTCMGRFFNFYLLIPFSSIALSTFAGGGQMSQTGVNYLKNMLAVIFEIVAMAIALTIIGPFLQGSIITKQTDYKTWFTLLEVIVKMITVTACFKGASATVRKAMNL